MTEDDLEWEFQQAMAAVLHHTGESSQSVRAIKDAIKATLAERQEAPTLPAPNGETRDTIPAPPPSAVTRWPGLEEDTACETPRALTPIPETKISARRSSDVAWGPLAGKSVLGMPAKLPVGAGRIR